MMTNQRDYSRVMWVEADTGRGRIIEVPDRAAHLGGSGLAATLYEAYGLTGEDWSHPGQPIIFAIGPLTSYFPMMSKVVCAFRSPYTNQYAESHAGGRLAMALRFAGLDGLMITGRAKELSALVVGSRQIEIHPVGYLKGAHIIAAGRALRKFGHSSAGRRSVMRIGPAGESGSAMASINIDTYRHFGRLGSGAVLGNKNLKGVIVYGDLSLAVPEGRAYSDLYKDIFKTLTTTDMMRKYHDLGTAENIQTLNDIRALPTRNLTATSLGDNLNISGEAMADERLLRQLACAGCPVGCIHVALLREQFADEHQFQFRQVGYDYELLFAQGSMLGISDGAETLKLIDEAERQGLDSMSAGVALAWAAEASEKGLIELKETIVPLKFGDTEGFRAGFGHLARGDNDFYRLLSQGTLKAAAQYGGADFACVLGQEMAGYATGEVFFVSQAFGFRHSHLDSAGYSWDQTQKGQDAAKAISFLVEDEAARVALTSMVSCLFARKAYDMTKMREALVTLGLTEMADSLPNAAKDIQARRWRLKIATGFNPEAVTIPKRFMEVVTWKGAQDPEYLKNLKSIYSQAILEMGQGAGPLASRLK